MCLISLFYWWFMNIAHKPRRLLLPSAHLVFPFLLMSRRFADMPRENCCLLNEETFFTRFFFGTIKTYRAAAINLITFQSQLLMFASMLWKCRARNDKLTNNFSRALNSVLLFLIIKLVIMQSRGWNNQMLAVAYLTRMKFILQKLAHESLGLQSSADSFLG